MYFVVLFRLIRECVEEIFMEELIYTVKQVADYLKVNERTVYRMAIAGTMPAFKVGASWRFKKAEIERWIKEQHNQKH